MRNPPTSFRAALHVDRVEHEVAEDRGADRARQAEAGNQQRVEREPEHHDAADGSDAHRLAVGEREERAVGHASRIG